MPKSTGSWRLLQQQFDDSSELYCRKAAVDGVSETSNDAFLPEKPLKQAFLVK
jgi:hypothetical protein